MGYFTPGQPEFNHLRHLDLLITDPADPPSVETMLRQVAHFPEGASAPDDWFFDSFLFLHGNAPSGNALYADLNCGTSMCGEGDFHALPAPNPSRVEDWRATIEFYFAQDGAIDRLNRAVAQAATVLGEPATRRNVVLPIPYPLHTQWAFGKLNPKEPRPLNFSIQRQRLDEASEARLTACLWFVDECMARFAAMTPKHLHLLGFYWLYESVHYSWDVDDHWVLKRLYPELKARGTNHFWIPFYSTWNVGMMRMGQGVYWDCSFLQPNYMFYENITGVEDAALAAKSCGCGIEMEYYYTMEIGGIRTGGTRHERYRGYLDGGVELGYMTESACAWFQGANDLSKMFDSPDEVERSFYHDTYRFVKGTYKSS